MKKVFPWKLTLTVFIPLCTAGLVALPGKAQSLPLGGNTISMERASSRSGNAQSEFDMLRRQSEVARKVSVLESYLNSPAYCKELNGLKPFHLDTSKCFQTDYTIRMATGGTSALLPMKLLLIPFRPAREVRGPEPRAAALVISWALDTPSIAVPRLLYRWENEFHCGEVNVDKFGKTNLVEASKAKALYRSSLKLLEKYRPSVHSSLRQALARFGTAPIEQMLAQCWDVNSGPWGQRDMLLATSLATIYVTGQDYQAGVVNAAIDQSDFRNAVVQTGITEQLKGQIIAYLKNMVRDMAADLGKKLAQYLVSLFAVELNSPRLIPTFDRAAIAALAVAGELYRDRARGVSWI